MKQIMFSPSLMCADPLNLGYQLQILNKNKFDLFHIDIMDMNFIPNIALGFSVVKALNKFSTHKDIHLMVQNVPLTLKNIAVRTGDFISFHVETSTSIEDNIDSIRKLGARPGLVINPETAIEKIYPFLSFIDIIHIMTVNPGFSGQSFIHTSYDRVKQIKSIILSQNKRILLGVDGGIGYEQIGKLAQYGVDVFVLGTTCLFKSNFEKQVKKLLAFRKIQLKHYHHKG